MHKGFPAPPRNIHIPTETQALDGVMEIDYKPIQCRSQENTLEVLVGFFFLFFFSPGFSGFCFCGVFGWVFCLFVCFFCLSGVLLLLVLFVCLLGGLGWFFRFFGFWILGVFSPFYAGKKWPLKCLPYEMKRIFPAVCRSSVANSEHLDQVKNILQEK